MFREFIAPYERVVFDIGTGDGLFVYNCARQNPRTFFVGLDANRRPLQKISERIHRRPSKGGLPNILFIQSAVEALPSELEGIAVEVYVNFPWGGLLAAVAGARPEALNRLRDICAPGALLTVVVGFDPVRDRAEMERLELSSWSVSYLETTLTNYYRKSGFEIVGSECGTVGELAVETSWARRLRGNDKRSLFRLQARAMDDSLESRFLPQLSS